MRNDPNVMRWCRQNQPLHWGDHEDWFRKQREDPSIEMWAITSKDNAGEDIYSLVGVCGLTDIDHLNRRAEFSLYIGKSYWGKGLGTYALFQLFLKGFNDLNLNLIWGETFKDNPARKLFRHMGMTEEGTRRSFYYKNGLYTDAILYSIKAEEFDNGKSYNNGSI
jgi:RimJ/RimL family protein N-acetyltransferase